MLTFARLPKDIWVKETHNGTTWKLMKGLPNLGGFRRFFRVFFFQDDERCAVRDQRLCRCWTRWCRLPGGFEEGGLAGGWRRRCSQSLAAVGAGRTPVVAAASSPFFLLLLLFPSPRSSSCFCYSSPAYSSRRCVWCPRLHVPGVSGRQSPARPSVVASLRNIADHLAGRRSAR